MSASGNLLRAVLSRDHVCPWWLAYSFDNRLRRWIHRPELLLGPYVRRGMTVLDLGCRLESFMDEIYDLLKHGGNYFLAEPIGHVSAEKFGHISKAAVKAGFEIRDAPPVRFSRALVFGKSS
jgi:hypothetical protein